MTEQIVSTDRGQVRGVVEGQVMAYRGIPYAASPVGRRRFAPPARHEGWTGVLDVAKAGPAAPQRASRLANVMGDRAPDWNEDGCLNLNVWAPRGAEKLPVLVWFHGGGFTSGSGGWDWYDGGNLAALGDIVVVTANYRLGALGYLYKPELGADNLGPRDQGAVLRWVHDNIAAFGGDPDLVTVGGQSAGAYSALYLALDPATSGLVRRVLAQSGPWSLPPMDPAQATENADRFLKIIGDPYEAPVERILDSYGEIVTVGEVSPPLYPVLGGAGFPAAWPDALDQLQGKDVVVGCNDDELTAFPGATIDIFTPGLDRIAADGYLYRWHRGVQPFGATHCAELPYLFQNFDAFAGSPMVGEVTDPVIEFPRAVAAFVATGTPTDWERAPEVRHFG